MLDLEVFNNQMGKLQAAHGRRINSEANDYWFNLCKDLDDATFSRIIEKLCYGEKFPTFGMFRNCRMDIEGKTFATLRIDPKSKCRWCKGNGKIVYEREDGVGQSYIGRCMACKLITNSNRMLFQINPCEMPSGYVLDSVHISNNEWYEKKVAQGEDPFSEEFVRGTPPTAGNVAHTTDSDGDKESRRRQSHFKEKERAIEWQDKYF
jgi:hypothetical protein